MLQKEIESRLSQYQDPYLEKDLLAARAIKRIVIEGNQVEIDIVLGYPHLGVQSEMTASLQALLAPLNKNIVIKLSSKIDPHAGKQGIAGLPNVQKYHCGCFRQRRSG